MGSAWAVTLGLIGAMAALGPAWAEDGGAKIALKGGANAAAVACVTCHGAEGGGNDASAFPRLAGLDAGYLARRLNAYATVQNKNPVMSGIAAALTEQERQDVSAYFSGLPPTTQAKPPQGVATEPGEKLANMGDMAGRALPACNLCHGPNGLGAGAVVPPLAGQPAGYLKAQITAWKSGQRSGDPLGLMAQVAARLTDQEVASLGAYYAAQPVGKAAEKARVPVPAQTVGLAGETKKPSGELAHHGDVAPGREPDGAGYFQPPAHGAYPEGPMGKMVALGEAVFNTTNTHPVSSKYAGNRQVCSGCHLDGGRLANSAPLWASWVSYPAYRSKNDRVNTFIERVQGCFQYSMNAQASETGHPPAADSTTVVSLISYVYWLATGAPTGDHAMPGRGYVKLTETQQGFDAQRGSRVYAEKCAVCHGANGEGHDSAGQVVFPPLWGKDSYNWGAGMHRIDTAAAYIKLNMPPALADPVSRKGFLSDQEAWDVAAYINSQLRPQDPRFDGDFASTRKQFHSGKYDLYDEHLISGEQRSASESK